MSLCIGLIYVHLVASVIGDIVFFIAGCGLMFRGIISAEAVHDASCGMFFQLCWSTCLQDS